MRSDSKNLVVGTTPDYIDLIRGFSSGNTIFITESVLRLSASEPCPVPWEELLSDFQSPEIVFTELKAHLDKYNFSVLGVTAFDCESLSTASFIAEKLGLPFVSSQAVENCRDKLVSKQLWRAVGLKTPESEIISSEDDAQRFFRRVKNKIVLKPKTGAGSELVFLCSNERAAAEFYKLIKEGLKDRKSRLYNSNAADQIVGEEFIEGSEFSADFTVSGDNIEIIRLTRKIKREAPDFGITGAYLLLNAPPPDISLTLLKHYFLRSCQSLGITRAICMIDFFVCNGDVILLETAPRPGGDCLPFLLEKAAKVNILKAALDFSTGAKVSFRDPCGMKPHLGIRIIADKAGILEGIDISLLMEEEEIVEIRINKKTGSVIRLPPEDYDSRILGHVIVERKKTILPELQVKETLNKMRFKIAGD